MPTKKELIMLQSLPLEIKIMKSLARIKDWIDRYGEDGVYISFSGGKDSTVLLNLIRREYPNIKAVFVDTGLEYTEIKEFVKSFDNVEILRPKMNFRQVIEKYGYPIISKSVANCIRGARLGQKSRINLLNGKDCDGTDRKSKFSKAMWKPLLECRFEISDMCCDIMKKAPMYLYQKQTGRKPFVATLTEESMLREKNWIESGCNAFNNKHPSSTPLAFWTEQDILYYIKENNINIASAYGDIVYDSNQISIEEILKDCTWMDLRKLSKLCTTGCDRTGCMFCLFGMHLEVGETRLQRLHRTHPKIYNYVLGGGEFDENGMWKPNNKGLGFKFVMDEVNRVMGKEIYRY